jgi:hypothetical protein
MSRFVPICPMTSRCGPASRDRVGPGREPESSDGHIQTFGADRDFAGALPNREKPNLARTIPPREELILPEGKSLPQATCHPAL